MMGASAQGAAMTTITPEQRQEIEKAGDEPVRIEDPETHQVYIVLKEEVYKRLQETMDQSDLTLHEFEEFIPNQ
jgi:uncharacterized protein